MNPSAHAEIAKAGDELLVEFEHLSELTAREMAARDAGDPSRVQSLMAQREAAFARAAPLMERLLSAPRDGNAAVTRLVGEVERAARALQEQDTALLGVLAARRAEIGAELEQLGSARAVHTAYGAGGRGPTLDVTR